VGRIALAVTPWSIRCPGCKARLRIRGWALPVSGLAVLVGVGLALLLLRTPSFTNARLVTRLAVIAAGVIPLELLAALLVVNTGSLAHKP